MILHLLTDDKFADYTINQFSKPEKESTFLLICEDENCEIKYIKNKNRLLILSLYTVEYNQFIENLHQFAAIVTHGLFYPWQEKIILSAPSTVKIAWVFWGGEIYGRSEFRYTFFAPKTKILYWLKQIKRLIKGSISKNKSFFVEYDIYKRINFCLTDEHEEFEFVNKYTHSNMEELWYNYYSIEETLGELINETINSTNILIGNSCTLENNHVDVFKKLTKFDIGNSKLIVPLSYGEDWLKTIIVKKGKMLFGNSFLPLMDFMKRDSYNQYLLSCSIVVMNQYRPQAQGNIITSLWLGAKLYLSKKSIAYTYFKRIGICFFSIEDDLVPSNVEALEPLNKDKVEINRQVLLHEYGKNAMRVKINKIIAVLNK